MEHKATSASSGMFAHIAAVPALIMAVFCLPGMPQPANSILYERWDGIPGSLVDNLTSSANFPNTPTTQSYLNVYEAATDVGDNIGTRTRGYITPPTTGSYTFWIASDDCSELWLGTSSNPATKTRIAFVFGWNSYREWGKYPEQQSAPIALTAGVKYYIETLHKEGELGDHLSVGWQGPGITGDAERPIPGSRLSPFLLATAPTITTPATTPFAVTATVGTAYSYTVVATGTTPITYSATGLPPSLSINATTGAITGTPTTAGSYSATVTATNGVSPAASKVLSFTVGSSPVAPTITTPATTPFAVTAATATFTVAATGTSLTYQWKKNGANVPSGGASAAYTTPAVTTADDGAVYTCVVTSGAQSVTTNGASKLIVEFRAGKLTANDVVALRVNASEVVTTPQWEIPDYVFEKDYELRSLADLERYVNTHKHLPEMPSAKDIRARGMNLSEMNVQLLKNVEELTLRLIALQKEMKDKDARMQHELDALRSKLGNR